MCLAIPGRVVEIYEVDGLKMGVIDFSGALNRTCLEYVPETTVGEYVIVHAGFAISVLNEEEASKSLQVWEQFSTLGDH
jgi:hydrogenase expression/formation protein HypC